MIPKLHNNDRTIQAGYAAYFEDAETYFKNSTVNPYAKELAELAKKWETGYYWGMRTEHLKYERD
jgi:hypothetical protein